MTAFYAYPSKPGELVNIIRAATRAVQTQGIAEYKLKTWEENDIPGRFIRNPIVEEIRSSNFIIADITYYNFNVFYEIGLSIAYKKCPHLTKCTSLTGDGKSGIKIPLLDTIGYEGYQNSAQLAAFLTKLNRPEFNLFGAREIDREQPVYYLRTPDPLDFDIKTISRLKKARLGFRIHDPEESGPLTSAQAIDNIVKSHGVVMHLLSSTYRNAFQHNMSMAFCAGLAHGLDCTTLILQAGTSEPVPLDYRDLVETWTNENQIETMIGEFAPIIYEKNTTSKKKVYEGKKTKIQLINIGASAAENEFGELEHYFLDTDEYHRILRGEAQVAAGRKGSGKTALFSQVRKKIRKHKSNVVLDLQPEGSQLLKIKDTLLKLLSQGTKEHTVVAFWEYLICLELCHKIINNDKQVHMTNHKLYEPYHNLNALYQTYELNREGDFAERMLTLLSVIQEQAQEQFGESDGKKILTQEEITKLLYKHDIYSLRSTLVDYLNNKEQIWILFDNLDKGWSPYGVSEDDILLLRCLQDALSKIQRELNKHEIDCRSTLFLRNDILSLLIEQTPDRGKLSIVPIDWDDAELLRELIRRRIIYSLDMDLNISFQEAWSQLCVSHYNNEESSQYLIERCLMRPRSLIDLIQRCLSHAINVSHDRIESSDIEHGENSFSASLVDQISYELRDVFPNAEDVLYAFIEASSIMNEDDVLRLINEFDSALDAIQILDYLVWYGVLGIVNNATTEPQFIYDIQYDIKRMRSTIAKSRRDGAVFYCFNLGFHKGLEIAS